MYKEILQDTNLFPVVVCDVSQRVQWVEIEATQGSCPGHLVLSPSWQIGYKNNMMVWGTIIYGY